MSGRFFSLLIIITIICLFFSLSEKSNAEDTSSENILTLTSRMNGLALGYNIQYISIASDSYAIDDIIKMNNTIPWKSSSVESLNFGYSNRVFWFKFSTLNPLSSPLNWGFEIEYPHLDFIDVYAVADNKIINYDSTGDQAGFAGRDLNYKNITLFFNQQPGRADYYIKVITHSSVIMSLKAWTMEQLSKKIQNELFWLGVYYGFILVVITFNFMLFIYIREKTYLYYILWVISYGLYQFAVSGHGYQFIWSNSTWWANVSIPFFIFIGSFNGFNFGINFLDIKKNIPLVYKPIKILSLLMILFAFLSLLIPYYIAIKTALISVIIMSTMMIGAGIKCFIDKYRPSLFYVMGSSFLMAGVSIYALKNLGLLPVNTFTVWAQQVGSAIEVTFISAALTDRINILSKDRNRAVDRVNNELAQQNKDLNIANIKSSLFEERYATLIQGTDEIIFSMDTSWNILSINDAASRYFNISPENLINQNISTLIFTGSNHDNLNPQKLFLQKLSNFYTDKKQLTLKANFISPIKSEPQKLSLNLIYINISGKEEIFGKIKPVKNDTLQNFLISESQKISISNHLLELDEVIHRLTKNLGRYLKLEMINKIRSALKEVIINAIEHGNLNISYNEKAESLASNTYLELIEERRKNPRYKDTRVWIEYYFNSKTLQYKISDEGDGFDYSSVFKDKPLDGENKTGFRLINRAFDSLTFNRKGNIITLTKKINSI